MVKTMAAAFAIIMAFSESSQAVRIQQEKSLHFNQYEEETMAAEDNIHAQTKAEYDDDGYEKEAEDPYDVDVVNLLQLNTAPTPISTP